MQKNTQKHVIPTDNGISLRNTVKPLRAQPSFSFLVTKLEMKLWISCVQLGVKAVFF